MSLTQLNAISPIDGRYRNKTKALKDYFSEEALIKYRVQVEIEYFIALCEVPLPQLADFNKTLFPELQKFIKSFLQKMHRQSKILKRPPTTMLKPWSTLSSKSLMH